jgi:mycofactocin precursor
MSERAATTQEPVQTSEPDLADGPELLVEEVSIDGMCGVY